TCYKVRPKNDPLASDPVLRTGRFRDDSINRPEEELVGTMYEEQVLFGHAWVVQNASTFVYEGTGFHDGDSVPGLVGYEYDRQYACSAIRRPCRCMGIIRRDTRERPRRRRRPRRAEQRDATAGRIVRLRGSAPSSDPARGADVRLCGNRRSGMGPPIGPGNER